MALELARELRERPLLRRAVAAGAVAPRKALAILPVAHGEEEGFWTAAAMSATLAELENGVRAAGREPGEDTFETETIWLRMTAEQQDVLDAAIAAARESLGLAAPRWTCIEAICQEWLGTFGALVPEAGERTTGAAPDPRDLDAWRAGLPERTAALERQLKTIEEAGFVIHSEANDGDAADARTLDTRARRLVAARRGFDEALGPLARQILDSRVWEVLGYGSLEAYCRERLGLSARTVRQRAWLERQIRALPALGEALYSGKLTYSKALLVAKHATPRDVDERIAAAAATTCQQVDRESTEEEDRRHRAAGIRRLWGPKDAAQVMSEAILSAQAGWAGTYGGAIDSGQALAVVAAHFLRVSEEHRKSPMSRARREVLMRHGGT